jgi:hypothetical protein
MQTSREKRRKKKKRAHVYQWEVAIFGCKICLFKITNAYDICKREEAFD